MNVEQEVLDYKYDDSHVTVQPCKNNTLLATNLTWQSDRQYYEGDVAYRNGRMYVAKNNNIDKRPDITTNWMLAFAETFKETGFVLSNNVSDANNDIDISAGRCYDSTGLIPIVGTAMTKRLDASIALGSGTGGLFSGSKANSTWYHVFVIVKDNDGTVNYGFSTSITATDRPTGWTVYRRLGSVRVNGSGNIIGFIQNGSNIRWKTRIQDVYENLTSTNRVTKVLTTPLGISVEAIFNLFGEVSPGYNVLIVSGYNEDDVAPGSSSSPYFPHDLVWSSAYGSVNEVRRFTTLSSEIYYRAYRNVGYIEMETMGWNDPSLPG